MLDKSQMQEIQDLKLRGYTKKEIQDYYKEQGGKVPSRPTIYKYYDMDVIPDNPGIKLSKDKVFDVSPFRETVIAILEDNSRHDFCISSVYVLKRSLLATLSGQPFGHKTSVQADNVQNHFTLSRSLGIKQVYRKTMSKIMLNSGGFWAFLFAKGGSCPSRPASLA